MTWVAVGATAVSVVGGAIENKSANAASDRANIPINAARAKASALADKPYTAYSGEMVAPESRNEMAGSELARSLPGYFGEANKQFSGDTISGLMNPYTQNVTDIGLRDLTKGYGEQLAGLDRTSNMTDAFGIGRSAANKGELNRNYEQEYGDLATKGQAAAYDSAQKQFNMDRANALDVASGVGHAADTLSQTGANERSIAQAGDTAKQNEFLRGENWDINRIDPLVRMMGGQGTTQGPSSSTLSDLIGGASLGMGFRGMMGGSGGGVNQNQLNNSTLDAATNVSNQIGPVTPIGGE